jgi:hypothetical protein
MSSAGSISSLSIPLISGYGIGILRVSSDKKLKEGSPSIKTETSKKDQTGVTTLILNVAGPIPSLIARRVKTFHIFTSEIEGKEKQQKTSTITRWASIGVTSMRSRFISHYLQLL